VTWKARRNRSPSASPAVLTRATGRHVDHDEVVRLREIVAQTRCAGRDRLLARIGPAQEVGDHLASKPLLDLHGGALLGELQRDAGRRDVDECPVDGPEIGVRGQQQVAGDVGTDADRDRERVAIRALAAVEPVARPR
jgi:hypothetical protein